MRPDVPLNAWSLVRNIRNHPYFVGWYEDVRDHPEIWEGIAVRTFEGWVVTNSRLVQRYVFVCGSCWGVWMEGVADVG